MRPELHQRLRSSRLWVASLVIVTTSLLAQRPPPPDPLRICGFTPPPLAHPNDPSAITLTVWAGGSQQECTRPYLPALAAPRVTRYRINVESRLFPVGNVQDLFEQAAAVHRLPDIVAVNPNWLPQWSKQGFIVPLNDCVAAHPEFRRIRPYLWGAATYDGQILGIPYRVGFVTLFFSKVKLRALGWSETRIAALPEDIRAGRFTLHDMLVVARQAVRSRVVEPGFGIWSYEHEPPEHNALPFLLSFDALRGHPSTGQMIIQREAMTQALSFYRNLQLEQIRHNQFVGPDIVGGWNRRVNLRDAYVEDRVLFWVEDFSERGEWALDKAQDRGAFRYFEDHIGVALIPSAYAGQPGHIQSAGISVFVIVSELSSRRRNQAAACELLAKTLAPDVLAPMLERESATPLITSEHTTDSASDKIAYLQDYVYKGSSQPSWNQFSPILNEVILEYETSNISPDQATTRVIDRMRAEFGNLVIVRS